MAGGVVYTAVVHAPRENVRKRRNEAVRSHLKELRSSIPRRPRRPSLELLSVDQLPPEEGLVIEQGPDVAGRAWRPWRTRTLAQRRRRCRLQVADLVHDCPHHPGLVRLPCGPSGDYSSALVVLAPVLVWSPGSPHRPAEAPLRLRHWLAGPNEIRWESLAIGSNKTSALAEPGAKNKGPCICAPTSEKYNLRLQRKVARNV